MTTLNKKLNDYLHASKGYSKPFKYIPSNKSRKVTQTILFGILPSIAQLSLISAQCQGSQANNFQLPETATNQGLAIDVDGDGTDDFKIFDNHNAPYFADLHMQALNGGAVLTNGGSGTVKNYAANEVINGNGTNQYGGFWWLVFLNPANTQMIGPWGEPYSSSGYIGIKQDGKYGFIELTIHSGPVGGNTGEPYTISIADAGLATSSGESVMAGDCASLPVELVRFTSKLVDDAVVLNWKTASEMNNAGFEIQKSKDGKAFKHLSFVEGKGSTDLANNYSFQDKEVKKGETYYYRLKQIDFDGRFEYSNIVNVAISSQFEISELYPNPNFDGEVMVDLNLNESHKSWAISVYDVTGKILLTENRVVETGQSVQTFNLNDFAEGAYFFKFESENQRVFRKVFLNK